MAFVSMALLLFMSACQNGADSGTMQPASTESLVGNDKDENRCIGSVGYTWSVVKNTCIRIFEEGTPFVRYDVANRATDSSTVAYLVLSDDGQNAEMFFGSTDKPVVMDAVKVLE